MPETFPLTDRTHLDTSTRYYLLRLLEANPNLSQRELAREMGVSLGKTHYCLKALMEKGYVKAVNFKNSKNRTAYLYKLTPSGVAAKTRITARFLSHKKREYERLREEIAQLQSELEPDT